jgi:hypothetical protein
MSDCIPKAEGMCQTCGVCLAELRAQPICNVKQRPSQRRFDMNRSRFWTLMCTGFSSAQKSYCASALTGSS